jgi:hypothetical protein
VSPTSKPQHKPKTFGRPGIRTQTPQNPDADTQTRRKKTERRLESVRDVSDAPGLQVMADKIPPGLANPSKEINNANTPTPSRNILKTKRKTCQQLEKHLAA